ncbi:MAG: ATP-dependent DNA helicase [Bacilli bacterium]|nr:ATP-dependent DNA helicase [Bacilli bacterium]
MIMQKELRLSVHDLVDFLLRTGDIDSRIYNQDTMSRGSEIHANYQSRHLGNHISEYYLKTSIKVDDFIIYLDGRADGIYLKETPIIEELKSTVEDLDVYYKKNEEWNLGQAMTYAYMFLKEKKVEKCEIILTYISQLNDERKEHKYQFDFKTLEKKVINLVKQYLKFYLNIYEHKVRRNNTSRDLTFPFKKMRSGQKQFIALTEEIMKNGGVSFIEAPTGIGKTISALYPSVKSFSETSNDKIFYLTAKNTGKDAAYQASSILVEHGLEVGVIYITAKEKICASPGASCNPNECPYAKDYYTKLKSALMTAIKKKTLYNANEIKKITDKYKICPFEFSLDLSNYMDIVIADYNYFFDPIVHLERYFDMDASQYVVLVDEAHNLLDRASEMYSETLSYSLFKECRNDYRFAEKSLKRAFTRVNKLFLDNLEKIEIGSKVIEDIEHETYLAFSALNNNISNFLKENDFHPNDESIDFSRRLNRFLKLYELHNEADAIYVEKSSEKDISLNLLCLDPSARIRESLNLVKGGVLFSATLSPMDYYKNVLGGNVRDKELILPSPFPKENFKLMLAPAALKYKDRDASLNQVVDYINAFINAKKGNYLIYSPSFEYLEKLKPYFSSNEKKLVIYQNKEMADIEKKAFISQFLIKNEKSVIGFSVVGGAFAEGIDLVNDSLIGVVVIGVGLPTISFKRNLIKEYYQNKEINGFSYAYKHPGMNKVSQAVGRLIRSETDIGAALLIDDRYLTNEYRHLFKKEWQDYEVTTSAKEVSDVLKRFYQK